MKKPNILERLKNAIFGTPTKKPPQSTNTPAKRETYVFVTARGKKFHYDPCCSSLLNAKNIKMDLSKARAAGYTACDKCCYNYLHE